MQTKLLLLFALVALSLAAPFCTNEIFSSWTCPAVLTEGTAVFGGVATVSSSPSGNLRVVGTSSGCAFSFGGCSSTGISSSNQLLACNAAGSCSLTFDFGGVTMYSFTIGKAWAASSSLVITVRFYKDDKVVLSDLLGRVGTNCVDPSSGSWSPSGGFDKVSIEGTSVAVTDLSVCFNRAYLFTGGAGATPLVSEGDCIQCTDALGTPTFLQFLCNGASCNTLQFSDSDCSTFFITSPTITDTVSSLAVSYPSEQSVCVLTHNTA